MSTERYIQNSPVKTDYATTGSGAVSVLTTDTAIAAANDSRVEITITNDHATQIVYLALGTTAVANQGIRLNAAGGSYTTKSWTGAIRGISVGGTSTCLVVETG